MLSQTLDQTPDRHTDDLKHPFLTLSHLCDELRASFGILASIEGVQLSRDNIQRFVGVKKLCQRGPIINLSYQQFSAKLLKLQLAQ